MYLKYDKRVKSQPIYDPTLYKVVSIKGTQAVISRNGKTLTRNSSLLKKVESNNNSKPMLVTIKNKKEREIVRDKNELAIVPYKPGETQANTLELSLTPLVNNSYDCTIHTVETLAQYRAKVRMRRPNPSTPDDE